MLAGDRLMRRASHRNPWYRVLLFAIAASLFVTGYYFGNRYQLRHRTPPEVSAVLMRPPLPLPEFRLRDSSGIPFDRNRLSGHWTLLLFGSTSDPETIEALRQLNWIHNRMAGGSGLHGRLDRVLIATDPERDTPDRLADIAYRFDPRMTTLTGERRELRSLTLNLGLERSTDTDQDGPVDTATSLFLVNPKAELVALFAVAEDPASVARDIEALRDFYASP